MNSRMNQTKINCSRSEIGRKTASVVYMDVLQTWWVLILQR